MNNLPATGARLESLFRSRPELWSRFQKFYDSLWSAGRVNRKVLEICRLRIAAIHDCPAEWNYRTPDVFLSDAEITGLQTGRFDVFDHCERAALAIAEKMPFQHHAITDDDVKAVEDGYGATATVALLTATAFFDVRCRWDAVINPPASRMS